MRALLPREKLCEHLADLAVLAEDRLDDNDEVINSSEGELRDRESGWKVDLMELYKTTKAEIKEYFTPQVPVPSTAPAHVTTPPVPEVRQSLMAKRLPPVRIQPFNGDPQNWPMFSSDFRSTVHEVLELDADRLTVLRELLSPELMKSMARYLFDPALYDKAWEALENNYGKEAQIVESSLSAIDMLPCWKDYDYTGMRHFSCELNGILTNLTMVSSVSEISYAGNLRRLVAKTLPKTFDEWAKKVYKMKPQ